MPVAVLAAFVNAISGINLWNHGITNMLPRVAVGKLCEDLHVNRNTGVLHTRRCGDKLTAVERDVEIDVQE
jgi:hypothetical protein